MKQSLHLLISIVLFLLASVIIFSVKIVDYPSLGNLLVSKIVKKPVCKDCNVILISLDSLNANHLPCYGYARNTAPNLCKFGKENTLFTNMFSNANYTLPSHVSIFTGLYPDRHNVGFGNSYLPPTVPFLPEILQKNGYKTYFHMPTDAPHLPIDLVYYRGIDKITQVRHPLDWNKGLDILKKNNEKNQKTFLFLHTYWLHTPYLLENKERKLYAQNDSFFGLPERYKELDDICDSSFLAYAKRALEHDFEANIFKEDKKRLSSLTALYKKLVEAINTGRQNTFCQIKSDVELLSFYKGIYYQTELANIHDPKMVMHQKNLYDSKIFEIDEYLGNVFSYLKKNKLDLNTVVIVTSDHGEEIMEHGSWSHGNNLYDSLIKIPLIFHIPKQQPHEVKTIAGSVDIVPTLLNILTINSNAQMSGSNIFYPQLFGKKKYTRAVATYLRMIRDSEWKMIYKIKSGAPVPFELYNMNDDPNETNNLIFNKREIVDDLLKHIPQ